MLKLVILLKVCERVATHLIIEWPALQNATDQKRNVYDNKLLDLGISSCPSSRTVQSTRDITGETHVIVSMALWD